MTCVNFFCENNYVIGFDISGHSTESAEDLEGKLVCSAVSSAAYFTANTLTEIIGASADISIDDAVMKLFVTSDLIPCQPILKGLILHITQLAEQYPNQISVHTEV